MSTIALLNVPIEIIIGIMLWLQIKQVRSERALICPIPFIPEQILFPTEQPC